MAAKRAASIERVPASPGWGALETLSACHDLALAVSNMATFELDTLTGSLSWSPATHEVLGCAHAQVAARLRTLIAPLLAGPPGVRTESEYELEQSVEDRHGATRMLLVKARSWQGEHDATRAGLYGAVVDVTEQRRAEQELVDLIDRYRLLVELSPDAIVVHEGGLIRYANPAAGRLNRSSSETMIGQCVLDFVVEEEHLGLMERLADLDEAGNASPSTIVTLVAADGLRYKTESVAVRTTWEGRTAYQVIMRDISEREEARAALRTQATLVESVTDAIVALDESGMVTSWNPAAERIFGWTADEAQGRVLTALWQLPAPELGPILASLAEAGRWSGELAATRQDGAVVPIHVSLAPLRDATGGRGTVAVCSDQTLRHIAEAERARAEERFSSVVSALDEGIAVIGQDGHLHDTNPAAHAIFDRTVDELRTDLLDGRHFRPCDEDGRPLGAGDWPVERALATGAPVPARTIGIHRADGELVWLRAGVHVIGGGVDDPGDERMLVCSFTDITVQRHHADALAWAATHDELTNLPNRSGMQAGIEAALAEDDGVVAVLFCDLDRFKDVNDSLGHRVGDVVLCEVAERLRTAMRAGDAVGRLGGDEFLVMCRDVNGTDAVRVAERMLYELRRPIDVDVEGSTITVALGASIGVALTKGSERRPGDVSELLQAADAAMYRAKARGRNRVEVFTTALRDDARRRLDIREDLRIALDTGQLDVHYQPLWRTKPDAAKCVIAGFEALVRWDHPTRGRQNPADFVAVAEDAGLISALGMYVLDRACRQTVAWRRAGHDIYVSVNLSAQQLSDLHLVNSVAATLLRTGLPATALWLELTESALAEEGLDAVSILDELVSLGVRISIDDFGTGYSSLGRLRHYPVSALKVDRSFVADMTTATAPDGHGDGGAIVESAISLAHRLGLAVIAEGVETPEQLRGLSDLHCELSQGFLLGRPVPADEVSFRPLGT